MYQGYESREAVDKRRRVADAMMARGATMGPRNIGEGLSAIGQSLFGMLAARANDKQRATGEAAADRQFSDVTSALMQEPQRPEIEEFPIAPVREGGSRSWRNNNPGNLEFGPFAERNGAVGSDGRFAIFPDEDAGRGAMESLLFGPSYANLSISDAIHRYAPPSENDSGAYVNSVAQNAGVAPDTVMASLPPDARKAVVDAMIRHEGWTPGEEAMPQRESAMGQQQPQGGMSQLMQLAGNDWLNPQQAAVAQALLQQQIARNAPPELTSGQREYEMARQQGFQGSFLDYRTALAQAGRAQTSVNVNTAGEPERFLYGSDAGLPAGWRIDRQTGEASPIPGGPAAQDAAGVKAAAAAAAEQGARSTSLVLEDIGRLREKVQNQKWYSPVTGVGSLLANIPGTDARDASALATTITANIGFDRLQQMREASPTGGALGAVSERELTALQSVLGNIELSQSEDQLLANLERLDTMYRDIMRKFSAYPNAAEFGVGDPEPSGRNNTRLRFNPATGELE